MPRTTQDKFETMLAAIAAEHDLELVNDRQWANTGTYRLESSDSFAPVVSMQYQFNDGYATFEGVVPANLGDIPNMLRDYAGGPITPHGTHFPYVKPEELGSRVLSAVRRHLATRKEAGVA